VISATPALPDALRERLVRYAELRPCTNAFIDARSPGSDQKENFTIIGPGVAENPRQYVHIREPHGFNIGAARQPPACTNSLHSHDTEEVFIVHTGTWRFFWGEHGDAGEVTLFPGDTITIPIHVFRGFENVGEDMGFMFAVLGGDDPGRVHWAPHVIEKARDYGLVLLKDGRLIDTTQGETLPDANLVVHPSNPGEIAYIRTPSTDEMRHAVLRHPGAPKQNGVRRQSLIRQAAALPNRNDVPSLSALHPHSFAVDHFAFAAGARTPLQRADDIEVLLVHAGRLIWRNEVDAVTLSAGDTFTIPRSMARSLEAVTDAEIFVVSRHTS
jgi:quercetin dioxygenase-like cupin family protein